MKKLIIILAAVVVVGIFSGCASVTQGTGSNFYSTGTVVMEVRAEATNTVYFGIFGEKTYPLAEEIAMEHGITRIALVERYRTVGPLGIWTEFTTIVIGERGGAIQNLTSEEEETAEDE